MNLYISFYLLFLPHLFRFLSFSPPQLILNDRTVPITAGSASGVNVANSAHPCVEGPCANGGTCRPKWDSYECDCPLGYDGKHCQKGQLQMKFISFFLQNWIAFWHSNYIYLQSCSYACHLVTMYYSCCDKHSSEIVAYSNGLSGTLQ